MIRGRRTDVYAVGVGIVAIVTFAVRFAFGGQFAFFSDDWTYLVRINTLPFEQYLLESYNGHVGPGQFLLVWAVATVAPLSFTAATLVATTIGVLSVVFWGMALREVFGPRLVLLLPLAALALSPMQLWANVWWASAVQAGPLQLCTAAMVWCAARWARRPGARRLVWLLLCFLAGLLFWEKAILNVIPAIAVAWMMVLGGWRERVRAVGPLVAALAATSVAYLGLYWAVLRLYPGTWYAFDHVGVDLSPSGVLALLRGVVTAARDVLAPGLLGGPWSGVPFNMTLTLPPATSLTTGIAVLVLLVICAATAVRRHGIVPAAMLVLYVVLAISLAAFSTTSVAIGLEAMKNPRLHADPLAVVWLAVALLLLPTATEVERGTSWRRSLPSVSWSSRLLRGVTPALLAVVCLATAAGTFVGDRVLWGDIQRTGERAWTENVRAGVSAEEPVLIADDRPPLEVYEFGYWPEEAWLSKMLGGVPGATFSGSAPTLSVVDQGGHLVPASIDRKAGTRPGPVKDCGYAVGAGETRELPLDNTLIGWNWAVEASFVAGGEASLVLVVDGTKIPMHVTPGVSTVMAPVNSAVTEVSVRSSDASETVCLVGLAFGEPVPAGA